MDGAVRDLHVSPDGQHLWVTLAHGGLKVIDLRTRQLSTVPTVGCPVYFAFAPIGRRLYVSYQCGGPGGHNGHDAIEIIDEPRRAPLSARAGPPLVGSHLAVSPDEEHLWADTHDACISPQYDQIDCPSGRGSVLHVMRASTLELLSSIRLPSVPGGAVPLFFPDGSRLAILSSGVHVVDRALGTVEEMFPLGAVSAAFTPDGKRFFVAGHTERALFEFVPGPAPDAALFNGIGTHWTGDGTTNDVVSSMHATAGQPAGFEPGRLGYAMAFDGSTAGLEFGSRLDVSIIDGPATYAAWIKPRRIGSPMIIAHRTTASGWQFSIGVDGRPAFCLADTDAAIGCGRGGVRARQALSPNEWRHVAVVRTETRVALFIDGEFEGGVALDGYQPPAPHEYGTRPETRFAAGPGGPDRYIGLLDEIVMFRRALSGDEISRLMRATTVGR